MAIRRITREGRWLLAAATVAASLSGASAAHGAKVYYHEEGRFGFDSMAYEADPGERNQLRLYHDSALHERARMVNLTDAVTPITPVAAPGPFGSLATTLSHCVVVPVSAAYCRFRDVANLYRTFTVNARLGDQNDLGRVSYVEHADYAIRFVLEGGTGDDHLIGSPALDAFVGGPGADRIDAGAGDDLSYVRDGAPDAVTCGPGFDFVEADVQDVLDGCEDVQL